jgi:hypothetical protein
MRKTATNRRAECFEYWSRHDDEILMKGFVEAEIHIRRALLEIEQTLDTQKSAN